MINLRSTFGRGKARITVTSSLAGGFLSSATSVRSISLLLIPAIVALPMLPPISAMVILSPTLDFSTSLI